MASKETFYYEGLGELREGQVLFSYRLLDPVPFAVSENKTVFLVTPATDLVEKIAGAKIEIDTPYLMKFINPPSRNSSETTKRNYEMAQRDRETQFNSEVVQLAKNNHPNIAKVFDYGIHSPSDSTDLFWFVEEYVDGADLKEILDVAKGRPSNKKKELSERDIIDEKGRLRIEFIINTIYNVAEGLSHLHTNRIAHGDLRPANTIIRTVFPRYESKDETMKPVLTDFGSSNVSRNTELFQLGSMAYRAPEIIRAVEETEDDGIPSPPAKLPADRWSLGLMLYEMLTGELPYDIKLGDWSQLSKKEFEERRDELVDKVKSGRLVLPSDKTTVERFEAYANNKRIKPIMVADWFDNVTRELLQRNRGVRLKLEDLTEKIEDFFRKRDYME